MTLAFCRLTDPVKSAGKPTHSLSRLIARIDGRKHPKIKQELQTLLDELKVKTEPFRRRRNQAVAHSDLGVTLKITKNPLPGISRADIEAALEVLRRLMNRYEQEFTQGITMYEEVFLPLGSDGNFLVDQLKRGVAMRDLERTTSIDPKVWKQGRYKDA